MPLFILLVAPYLASPGVHKWGGAEALIIVESCSVILFYILKTHLILYTAN